MSIELLREEIQEADIIVPGVFKLSAGEESGIYADVKKVLGYPKIRRHIAEVILGRLDDRTTAIAADTGGSNPLGTELSSLSGLPLTSVRKEINDHGRNTIIDGYVPGSEDKITAVEDVFSSGKSLLRVSRLVELRGAEIIDCFVVVNRGDTSRFPFPIDYLFNLEEFRLVDNEVSETI